MPQPKIIECIHNISQLRPRAAKQVIIKTKKDEEEIKGIPSSCVLSPGTILT